LTYSKALSIALTLVCYEAYWNFTNDFSGRRLGPIANVKSIQIIS